MNADEFEGSLYTILSEQPLDIQIIHITEGNDDYTISDHVSQHFGMLIGETMICLSYHQNKRLKILKYESFIILLLEIQSIFLKTHQV